VVTQLTVLILVAPVVREAVLIVLGVLRQVLVKMFQVLIIYLAVEAVVVKTAQAQVA
jgi:hypothetical protein